MGPPRVPVTDRGTGARALEEARKQLPRQKTPRSLSNKQVELAGEAAARNWVKRQYSERFVVTELDVPRRGAKGAPVLDLFYELRDRKTGEIRYAVVEAKGGTARLSRGQRRADWLLKRIEELERKHPSSGLGPRLRQAAVDGRIDAPVLKAKRLPGWRKGDRRPSVDVEHVVLVEDRGRELCDHVRNHPSPASRATGGRKRQSKPKRTSSAAPAVKLAQKTARATHRPPPATPDTPPPKFPGPKVPIRRPPARGSGGRLLRLARTSAAGTVIETLVGLWSIEAQTQALNEQARSATEDKLRSIGPQLKRAYDDPAAQRRFAADPLGKFWYEVEMFERFGGVTDPRTGVTDPTKVVFLGVELRGVSIVDTPGKAGCRISPREHGRRCKYYVPVFEESLGRELAARGRRLPDQPGSHGVTEHEWLGVAEDYVVFARQHPELEALAKDAFARYRLRFYADTIYRQRMIPAALHEAYEDELWYLRQGRERGTHMSREAVLERIRAQ